MSASIVIYKAPQVLGKRADRSSISFHPENSSSKISISANQGLLDESGCTRHILVNGKLLPHTKKRYQCTQEGCNKAYSKPSRLVEHERSHTGERPYICEICKKSYSRETHLHAHARSHLPTSSRPFICDKSGCQKRFWTAQHLKVHIGWHEGAKPFACSQAGCAESFAKHHQLRSHLASVHAPPGTKSYQCEHTGCTKSFSTNQKLKAHVKTHDDKRYTCVHSECLATSDQAPNYFPTWSALQNHIRTAHPPTCYHPSCTGRTFSSQKGLRAHMKLHEQRDLIEALETMSDDNRPVKRRRGGEWGRDWLCDYESCAKDFKSKRALAVHTNVTHLGQRNFVCSFENCRKAYAYKHLLQRHIAKSHGEISDTPTDCLDGSLSPIDGENESAGIELETALDIDTITGNTYAKAAETRVNERQALRCPFPYLHFLAAEPHGDSAPQALVDDSKRTRCVYVFSRAYDLRRHLRTSHNFIGQKESLDLWVAQQKLAWYTQ